MPPFGEEVFTDLQAVRPVTAEKPVAALDYGAIRPWQAPEACGTCLIEVRRPDEGSDAVPAALQVVDGGNTVSVLGPKDVVLVVTLVDGKTGRLVSRRVVTAH